VSAETMRRAAALMRARAQRCARIFGGEFRIVESDSKNGWPRSLYNGAELLATRLDHSDAEHIASWHPAVALAVADLLDKAATLREFLEREPEPTIFGRPVAPIETAWDKEALAVARAYLGEA